MKIRELLEQVAPTGLVGAFGTGYRAGQTATVSDLLKTPVTRTPTPSLAVPQTPLDAANAKRKVADAHEKAKREIALAARKAQEEADKAYREKIATLSSVPGGMVPESTLNEYSLDFADDLETLIRNQLGRADDERRPSRLSYEALSGMLGHMIGQSVVLNKTIFEKIYNSNTDLQNYIEKYDDNGITLSTKVSATPLKTKTNNPIEGDKTVPRMARGGRKYLSKSRNNP